MGARSPNPRKQTPKVHRPICRNYVQPNRDNLWLSVSTATSSLTTLNIEQKNSKKLFSIVVVAENPYTQQPAGLVSVSVLLPADVAFGFLVVELSASRTANFLSTAKAAIRGLLFFGF